MPPPDNDWPNRWGSSARAASQIWRGEDPYVEDIVAQVREAQSAEPDRRLAYNAPPPAPPVPTSPPPPTMSVGDVYDVRSGLPSYEQTGGSRREYSPFYDDLWTTNPYEFLTDRNKTGLMTEADARAISAEQARRNAPKYKADIGNAELTPRAWYQDVWGTGAYAFLDAKNKLGLMTEADARTQSEREQRQRAAEQAVQSLGLLDDKEKSRFKAQDAQAVDHAVQTLFAHGDIGLSDADRRAIATLTPEARAELYKSAKVSSSPRMPDAIENIVGAMEGPGAGQAEVRREGALRRRHEEIRQLIDKGIENLTVSELQRFQDLGGHSVLTPSQREKYQQRVRPAPKRSETKAPDPLVEEDIDSLQNLSPEDRAYFKARQERERDAGAPVGTPGAYDAGRIKAAKDIVTSDPDIDAGLDAEESTPGGTPGSSLDAGTPAEPQLAQGRAEAEPSPVDQTAGKSTGKVRGYTGGADKPAAERTAAEEAERRAQAAEQKGEIKAQEAEQKSDVIAGSRDEIREQKQRVWNKEPLTPEAPYKPHEVKIKGGNKPEFYTPPHPDDDDYLKRVRSETPEQRLARLSQERQLPLTKQIRLVSDELAQSEMAPPKDTFHFVMSIILAALAGNKNAPSAFRAAASAAQQLMQTRTRKWAQSIDANRNRLSELYKTRGLEMEGEKAELAREALLFRLSSADSLASLEAIAASNAPEEQRLEAAEAAAYLREQRKTKRESIDYQMALLNRQEYWETRTIDQLEQDAKVYADAGPVLTRKKKERDEEKGRAQDIEGKDHDLKEKERKKAWAPVEEAIKRTQLEEAKVAVLIKHAQLENEKKGGKLSQGELQYKALVNSAADAYYRLKRRQLKGVYPGYLAMTFGHGAKYIDEQNAQDIADITAIANVITRSQTGAGMTLLEPKLTALSYGLNSVHPKVQDRGIDGMLKAFEAVDIAGDLKDIDWEAEPPKAWERPKKKSDVPVAPTVGGKTFGQSYDLVPRTAQESAAIEDAKIRMEILRGLHDKTLDPAKKTRMYMPDGKSVDVVNDRVADMMQIYGASFSNPKAGGE